MSKTKYSDRLVRDGTRRLYGAVQDETERKKRADKLEAVREHNAPLRARMKKELLG